MSEKRNNDENIELESVVVEKQSQSKHRSNPNRANDLPGSSPAVQNIKKYPAPAVPSVTMYFQNKDDSEVNAELKQSEIRPNAPELSQEKTLHRIALLETVPPTHKDTTSKPISSMHSIKLGEKSTKVSADKPQPDDSITKEDDLLPTSTKEDETSPTSTKAENHEIEKSAEKTMLIDEQYDEDIVRLVNDIKSINLKNEMASSHKLERKREISWDDGQYLDHMKFPILDSSKSHAWVLDRKASIGPCLRGMTSENPSGIMICLPKRTAKVCDEIQWALPSGLNINIAARCYAGPKSKVKLHDDEKKNKKPGKVTPENHNIHNGRLNLIKVIRDKFDVVCFKIKNVFI